MDGSGKAEFTVYDADIGTADLSFTVDGTAVGTTVKVIVAAEETEIIDTPG